MQFCQQSFEDDNENMFVGIVVWHTKHIKKNKFGNVMQTQSLAKTKLYWKVLDIT